jgi:hypothetical protein
MEKESRKRKAEVIKYIFTFAAQPWTLDALRLGEELPHHMGLDEGEDACLERFDLDHRHEERNFKRGEDAPPRGAANL